jgi:Tfp pilus assembly protein PilN
MRAVNLIPSDLRVGRSASSGGIGAYVVVGALALLVAMVSLFTLSNRTIADKQAQLTTVENQAAAAEKRTGDLQAYSTFSTLSKQRADTVKSLAGSRFDWAHAMTDVARVLPKDAWLATMRATVAPGVSVDGAADPLRQSLNLPAIELTGCTTSQANVARIVADLRAADGVRRVSLSSANKSDAPAATSGTTDTASAGTGGDCTQGNASRPRFSLTLFYDAPAAPAASGAAAAAAPSTTTTSGG